MRQWFALPQFENEYETFAARVLHHTLLLLMGVVVTFVFFVSSPAQLVFIPFILGVFGGCYYLLHTGRLRLASMIFVSGLWSVITLASFSINGIRNSSISSYAIVIIYAAVLFRSRPVIIFTIMSILSVMILAAGETTGILPLRTTPLYLADRLFQMIALFSAAGILLTATSHFLRQSLERVRRHEAMLLQRNRELERTLSELRLSEEKYRLLFENISVQAVVYGQDGEIILANRVAAGIVGSTPEAIRGRNLREFFPSEVVEAALQDHARVMAEGKAMVIESRLSMLNGAEVYALRHLIPLPGSPPQMLSIITDLTEKHLSEQRERELALAQEKNAFLTEFFSTLSHDIKTPLAIMNTSLYLLSRASTPEQREEKIAQISEQVALMDKYIQDMLTISRLEHLPSVNFQELDLNQVIEQVTGMLRPRIESKQLRFEFGKQPGLPVIRGDLEQLQRLATNLIENAVNYTPAGGEVIVRTQADSSRVMLEVVDSGIGIEPAAVPHIFERFFRTKNAKVFNHSGTGLGLAIVKKIAETHRAAIEVQSKPGEGTTFSVQFPL
jgi:PAS domain S-box-containing protein